MITYRDRTWCAQRCGNLECVRNYTDKDRQNNENGVDLPLSIGDMRTTRCGYVDPKEPT